MKDPYIFDFIPNGKKLKEVELEDALVQQIRKAFFLLIKNMFGKFDMCEDAC